MNGFRPKRRKDDEIFLDMEVVDDTDPNRLTLSEVRELKWLARLSKTSRWIMVGVMSLVGLFGLPALMDLFSELKRHFH